MVVENLRRRLDRIELSRGPARFTDAIRIVTRSEEDAASQTAELRDAGRLGDKILLIDRRIVSPKA